MSRLGDTALGFLRRDGICAPVYDRTVQHCGIVHFGLGAFARAHLAWYTDAALNTGERDWLITGVSLRSPAVMAQMNPQQGLYSLTEHGPKGSSTRIIGALREVLVADRHPQTIIDRIASPHCHVVSFTVTEKGYCRAPDGALDLTSADHGFYPLLAGSLARRAQAGLPGVTLLSCDNLAHNGLVLQRLVGQYLAARQPQVLDWFAEHCACPATMVDRIVPAMTPATLDQAQALLGGCRDEGAIFTEAFSQWVIEDRFAGPRPGWERHGAQIVADVTPYENAKLRMLNGAHSLLAYCGLDRGYRFVHEAIADPALLRLTTCLMLADAAPTIVAGPGQDLEHYARSLLDRFANPALNHALAQIAIDGSQKVPQRWLEVLAARTAQGADCPAILTGLAAWLNHVSGRLRVVDDPLAPALAAAWASHGAEGIVDAVLGPDGLLASSWHPSAEDKARLGTLLGS